MAAIEELDDSRAPSILGSNIVFLFFGTIGVLARFTARKFRGAPLGLDDLFVFLAWVSGVNQMQIHGLGTNSYVDILSRLHGPYNLCC